jgi:hypothetical protein
MGIGVESGIYITSSGHGGFSFLNVVDPQCPWRTTPWKPRGFHMLRSLNNMFLHMTYTYSFVSLKSFQITYGIQYNVNAM